VCASRDVERSFDVIRAEGGNAMTKRQCAGALTIVAMFAMASACSSEKKTEADQTAKNRAALFLNGSTFEIDGDLIHTGTNIDWDNAPNYVRTTPNDLVKSTDDEAFGNGAKEDSVDPGVVFGSIPPNKNDIRAFFTSWEMKPTGDGGTNEIYLYLGWTRRQEAGSVNFDIELNQEAPDAIVMSGQSGTMHLNRTPGDVLLMFDFAGGGGTVQLGYHLWITSGSDADCEAPGGTLPCWDKVHTLGPAVAQGAVNDGFGVTDPKDGNRAYATLLFGEAAINLTAAGLLPPGACKGFATSFVKSRSSTSFTSELKDFVRPIPTNINTCLYKVITFVCDQTTGQLHQSTVTLDGVTKQSATVLPSGLTESTLCGLSDSTGDAGTNGGAVFPNKAEGQHSGSVCIPETSGGTCPSGDAGADGG